MAHICIYICIYYTYIISKMMFLVFFSFLLLHLHLLQYNFELLVF